MYSLTSGVLMKGKLVNGPALGDAVQTFHRASDPWFYLFAQKILHQLNTTPGSSTPHHTVFIPTESYLFRYDRAVFWSGKLAFSYFHFPFNFLTRRLLDPFMKTRVVNHALHRS